MESEPARIDWTKHQVIPRGIAAALTALRFDAPGTGLFEDLRESAWKEVLRFCDRARLTLLLGWKCGAVLPKAVRARIGENLSQNEQKLERLKASYIEIAQSLDAESVEYVAMRSLTHLAEYVPEPRLRCQGDIDLFCPPESIQRAAEKLGRLGFRPMQELAGLPTDHLPAMIRKNTWQWKGNHYDPDMPVSVDLHFRHWDERTERFAAPGTEQFWERRSGQTFDGLHIPCLHPADRLASAALHLFRHLLRASLVPSHVYEVGWFLHTRVEDAAFWEEWRVLHAPELRRIEAIVFRLAAEWFGCRLPPAAAEEIACLPEAVRLWFAEYAASGMEAFFRPNKSELWLHFALLESSRDRRAVFLRRVAPLKLPATVTLAPDVRPALKPRFRQKAADVAYAISRARFHLRALPPVLREGTRWWLRTCGISRSFWMFMATSALFDFGLATFFLLYNLYLLDLGYREDFLGTVAGAMTAGSIAGTLPAGLLARRFGLRNSVLFCVAGAALVSGSRSLATGPVPVVALAFLDGVVTSVWAVSHLPTIARSAGPRNRPLAYSLCTVEGMGMGIVAGLAGGWMPKLLMNAGIVATSVAAKRTATLVACGAALLAVLPASRLRLPSLEPEVKKIYPRGPFIVHYLAAIAVWSLATGAFNPFVNAYFSHHLRLAVERVGLVYVCGQLAQITALLAAPLVLRRLGVVAGITAMQLAAGVSLALLGATSAPAAAGLFYSGYVAFQWMSEPGLFTLLMSGVSPEQQTGASSLNFLVMFTMNALAAAGAGFAFVRFGYPAVLVLSGGVAIASALLFRGLLRKSGAANTSVADDFHHPVAEEASRP